MDTVHQAIAAVPPTAQLALAGLGALWAGTKIFSLLRLVLSMFVLSGTNLRKYAGKDTWAVVTGASDGLGKEFATQLAAKGFHLLLVSRTQSKLETFREELRTRYQNLQIDILAMDFAAVNNDADYAELAERVNSLDVGILVNNVGQSHSIPVPFTLTDEAEMENIININCRGTLKVTRIVAPGMQKRRRGLILTMGSFGGWMPTPLLATYSGSKAFLQFWSTALAAELKPDNVDVQLVLSYLVTTAMSKIRRPSLLIPSPKPFVRATLAKVGVGSWQNTGFTYTPYWSHAIMAWFVENTVGIGSYVGLKVNRSMHVDIRNRALRKAARDAKKN
ncbi:putative 3-ketoacyl- reductase [Rosellinia necatrix]|uniref:Very-long-chain 3-oxoacyl-CoA reductase n=1 Tax=Rosellinia necatrix TaxID=77044 RepID=A0A1W2TAT2_ROSNE|nr:putative 3-ketoacyl- reductase [Rosellinia necatrix]